MDPYNGLDTSIYIYTCYGFYVTFPRLARSFSIGTFSSFSFSVYPQSISYRHVSRRQQTNKNARDKRKEREEAEEKEEETSEKGNKRKQAVTEEKGENEIK